MDRITWHSLVAQGLGFVDLRVSSLLFMDYVVLLAQLRAYLQIGSVCSWFGWGSAHLSLRPWCSGWFPQMEDFRYLGGLFTSEGRMDQELNRQIGLAATVLQMLNWSIVVERAKEKKRSSPHTSSFTIFVPTLTYGHELLEVNKSMRLWIKVTKMSLCRVAGLSLKDRVRSSNIREKLRVQ